MNIPDAFIILLKQNNQSHILILAMYVWVDCIDKKFNYKQAFDP